MLSTLQLTILAIHGSSGILIPIFLELGTRTLPGVLMYDWKEMTIFRLLRLPQVLWNMVRNTHVHIVQQPQVDQKVRHNCQAKHIGFHAETS